MEEKQSKNYSNIIKYSHFKQNSNTYTSFSHNLQMLNCLHFNLYFNFASLSLILRLFMFTLRSKSSLSSWSFLNVSEHSLQASSYMDWSEEWLLEYIENQNDSMPKVCRVIKKYALKKKLVLFEHWFFLVLLQMRW